MKQFKKLAHAVWGPTHLVLTIFLFQIQNFIIWERLKLNFPLQHIGEQTTLWSSPDLLMQISLFASIRADQINYPVCL